MMQVSRWFALALICSTPLLAAASEVSTFAGTGVKGFSGDGGPAAKAQLNNPFAVSRGPDGFIYICDVDNHRIRRVAPDGTISTYAGSEGRGFFGDGGKATEAYLYQPYEMAWDKAGNLHFVALGSHSVHKVDAKTGIITTLAGNGTPGFAGDGGPAKASQLNQPHSLAFDAAGDLYIADIINHRIRKIETKTGMISTWAGTGLKATSPDTVPLNKASFHGPRALAFAPDGTLWLALREGNAILKLDPKAGTFQRAAGTGKAGFTGNGGPALQATLSGPKCVSLDAQGNVYLADTESHTIRKIDAKTGNLELVVGDGKKGNGPEGPPTNCRLNRPHGVFADTDGAIYIGDSENHRVRVVKP